MKKLLHKAYVLFIKSMVSLMPAPKYMLFAGNGSSADLCRHMANMGARKVLVVTDKPLLELGIVDQAIASLKDSETATVIFADVEPDPSYEVVAAGAAVYRQQQCDSLLAIGGGSSIDAAKIIGVAVSNPEDPKTLVGFGKFKNDIPPLYVIPTTAGTGSEATSGAVITDSSTHEKGIIGAAQLLPLAACLDGELMTGLPAPITAATGMDALTHAIEAYIGVWDRGDCQQCAATAVRMIFQHLSKAVHQGNNAETRNSMAYASYLAGQAINQVNVGNVHAIAHQLGALYGIPHGLANAIVLPEVLQLSLQEARPRLTELAALIGKSTAEEFISAVRELSADIGIPPAVDALQSQDFDRISERACKEAFGYPSPYFMNTDDVQGILGQIQAGSQ